ncbi:Uu.00g109320.m01.CDS01 [Anthostomella pinea]|uniref:Uu.00g109320.m01.CDS01 n=1 Tax=Anthostomella pinea TaxID=933095 RepID=A0AAI8YG27_9PEZI|nr:Uu.00g109320.m01.CDS01 [Anthostomella pinea]
MSLAEVIQPKQLIASRTRRGAAGGSVLKLVVFSIDFVTEAKQVHRQGGTDRNVDLATVADSVQIATQSLEDQLDEFDRSGEKPTLDPDEEQLRELAVRAAEIGRERAESLNKVATDGKSKWKSFKAVARGMWDADDIQKTEKKLNGIRDEISLGILIGIRKKVSESSNDSQRRMLEALEEVANGQAESREDSKHMIERLTDADLSGKERHRELVSLGIQLRDGINAFAISRSPSPMSPGFQTLNGTSEEERVAAEDKILNCLWYSTIADRQESISEAYKKTFQWIYEDPRVSGKTWSNFVDFLEGDATSYWITGKPGSGKSTLMKFINEDPRTEAFLHGWTAGRCMLKASFYFYYNGSDMQKSEVGLLRSILHSLLDQRRDLIPVAFKDRFRAALDGRVSPDPTLPELKRALKYLLLGSPQLCFFLSVDGLDEFDPKVSMTHVSDLVNWTLSLGGHSNVKSRHLKSPVDGI